MIDAVTLTHLPEKEIDMGYKFYFAAGSQDLYGDECLEHVRKHAEEIVATLNAEANLPYEIEYKPTLLTEEGIYRFFKEASGDEECAGTVVWMHTFSPAKNWIKGLKAATKPICHLHTQYNEALPFATIDMDFMNENQSAHGDREFGHIMSRMGISREIIVGHWKNREVQQTLALWMRTARGMVESENVRVCRVADNMRSVAVTEGDKVEAQIKFGWTVDAYPVNEVVDYVNAVGRGEISALTDEYYSKYNLIADGRDKDEFRRHVEVQAGIEIGFEKFLSERKYNAVVTHFGDLGGLRQLPGLAMQRLMEKGYGFGAEGDWKTAAMVRMMKVMADFKGTSFFEDYTYNFVPGREAILESHMLEICPSVAEGPISIRVCPLSMGNREDPARLIFTCPSGKAVATSLVDLGTRFRLIINEVDCLQVPEKMPRLPVATAYWRPEPSLSVGAEAWILAGGAHHTAFSYNITTEQLKLWAERVGIEAVVIDRNTTISSFKDQLRLGDACFRA
jgi:L-arabinose isomerase